MLLVPRPDPLHQPGYHPLAAKSVAQRYAGKYWTTSFWWGYKSPLCVAFVWFSWCKCSHHAIRMRSLSGELGSNAHIVSSSELYEWTLAHYWLHTTHSGFCSWELPPLSFLLPLRRVTSQTRCGNCPQKWLIWRYKLQAPLLQAKSILWYNLFITPINQILFLETTSLLSSFSFPILFPSLISK